jgi:Fe2+ or Zn2+ uptake regulation protein
MHFGGDQHYYETRNKQEHAHIICLRCGRVEEFYGDPLTRLRRQVEATFGFQILIARTEIGGYCSHCQALRLQEIESVLRQRKDAEVIEKKDRTPPVKSK